MAAVNDVNKITKEQIKALWGASKARGLVKDDLYSIILDVSGKENMTELTYVEAARALDRINNKKQYTKRTDSGGNDETRLQRRKIYYLTAQLGWNNNNDRINGFVKKIFTVDRLEWLSRQQCHKLIEILKQMVNDQGGGNE